MIKEESQNEVMTLTEVAEYLQLAERTVLRMAQRGEIPAAKVASQWRFIRSVIRDWLAAKMQLMPTSRLKSAVEQSNKILPLIEAVHPELINLDITPGSKDSILRQLVEPLEKTGFASNPTALLQSLIERERLMTTAIGHGIAMPHPRHPLEGMFAEPAIAIGLCPEGTKFDAVDDQLVHVFFLICATREEIHLQLMAKISWFARQIDLCKNLRKAKSRQAVMDLIARSTTDVQKH